RNSRYRCLSFYNTILSPTYHLSLHDALPISLEVVRQQQEADDDAADQVAEHKLQESEILVECKTRNTDDRERAGLRRNDGERDRDRKSTRLNSSHVKNSYAVFC